MAAAQKKVIVRLKGHSLAWGYLPQNDFLDDGQVHLIEVDARSKQFSINDIVAIFYVKDFNLDDSVDPERLGRRNYPLRPRGQGLWLRLEFHEMSPLEGLLHFDLYFLDELLQTTGLFLTPPDGHSNTHRLFVPRTSIRTLEVLGWVSSPSRKLAAKTAKQAALALQAGLFGPQD